MPGDTKPAGKLLVRAFDVEVRPSFLDYLSAGTEMSFLVAVVGWVQCFFNWFQFINSYSPATATAGAKIGKNRAVNPEKTINYYSR
jgi:hypothetical protein